MWDIDWYTISICILLWFLLSYFFIDNHWFFRAFFCLIRSLFFKKKIHILDETHYYGICWTTDVDVFVTHMNNAKYFRELDFAKEDFLFRSNIFQHVRKKNGLIVVGSCNMRYRRFIKVFQIFKISTKIVYWDKNSIYFEHRFITVRDNFVCAIAYVKQRITNFNVDEMMSQFVDKNIVNQNGNSTFEKPPIPEEIHRLIQLDELSSAHLREEQQQQHGEVNNINQINEISGNDNV